MDGNKDDVLMCFCYYDNSNLQYFGPHVVWSLKAIHLFLFAQNKVFAQCFYLIKSTYSDTSAVKYANAIWRSNDFYPKMDEKWKNYTYMSAARDAGIHPGMQTLLQTHWAPTHERGRQQNKGGVRWHTPLHWQSEPSIQCWFWVSKEQIKWACQLWGRSEQVDSNERKLFSAHFKNENQKTFLEAHRMFWFLALKSAVSWHIHPLIYPLEKQPNKMLFVSQGKQTTTEEGGILFSI